MSLEISSQTLSIPLSSIIRLGVEYWRLANWIATRPPTANDGTARHSLRRMGDFFNECQIEVLVPEIGPFDAGMAVRVVDSVEDPDLAKGQVMISEIISPIIVWRGKVVAAADVVTRTGTRD